MIVHLEKDRRIYRKTNSIINSAMPLNIVSIQQSIVYMRIYNYKRKKIHTIYNSISRHQISRINLMKNVQENIMKETKGLNKGGINCIHKLEDSIL